MRILIHDFAGHPFQTLLSESLAKRGHSVTHAYFAGDKGPKGVMNSRVFDGGGSVVFKAIGKKHGYEKSEFVARVVRDLSYRRSICDYIAAVRFDIVLSGNTPLWIQGAVLSASKASGAVFVFWCQDFYSIAVAKLLAARLPIIHAPIAWSLKQWDRLQFKRSSHVVTTPFKL